MYRIDPNSDIIEKIIEGDLCLLSSNYPRVAAIYNDVIYTTYGIYDKTFNSKEVVKKYSYHTDVATFPSKVLTVWAAAPILIPKEAIAAYKEQHPDTYIKTQTLYTNDEYYIEDYEIKSEDLEALNTELLAGKGPDLIILDSLPIEFYRKQWTLLKRKLIHI